ncbi:MAG: phosphoglycolate phosphatase [Cognaticolwellia sp.]|jgi:phosphoglycolate phosphatase
MKVLWLYDIDGTILSTEGAGRASMGQAFEQCFGVSDAFAGLSFAGATDSGITGQAFAAAGLAQQQGRLRAAYLPLLSGRLLQQAPSLCPGIHSLLPRTAQAGHNALLTGNWRAGARIKLEALTLAAHFERDERLLGAFGDDAADRNLLVPIAEAQARAAGLVFDRTVVIGDTPRDVECARAGNALAVAVCTGWSSREELHASSADLLLENLVVGADALLDLVRRS